MEEGKNQNQIQIQSYDIGDQHVEPNQVIDQHVLRFLDSTEEYLSQTDSLSMIVRRVRIP